MIETRGRKPRNILNPVFLTRKSKLADPLSRIYALGYRPGGSKPRDFELEDRNSGIATRGSKIDERNPGPNREMNLNPGGLNSGVYFIIYLRWSKLEDPRSRISCAVFQHRCG